MAMKQMEPIQNIEICFAKAETKSTTAVQEVEIIKLFHVNTIRIYY